MRINYIFISKQIQLIIDKRSTPIIFEVVSELCQSPLFREESLNSELNLDFLTNHLPILL